MKNLRIGDIFIYNSGVYKIKKQINNRAQCLGCDILDTCCSPLVKDKRPECSANKREDNENVIFVKSHDLKACVIKSTKEDNFIFKLVGIERLGETTHQKDEWKEVSYSYPSFLQIGSSAEIPMSDGRVLRTSAIRDFYLHNNVMVVSTMNTVYTFEK